MVLLPFWGSALVCRSPLPLMIHVGLCGEGDPVVVDVGGRPDVPGRGPSQGRVGSVLAFAGVEEGPDLERIRPLGAAVSRHTDVVGPGSQLVPDEEVVGVGFLPLSSEV